MKRMEWQYVFGLVLVLVSFLIYGIHYLIFGDAHRIFITLLGQVAFVPIQVLLVTLVVNQLLSRREKRAKLQKMNMVIGAFFSEVGTSLLHYFSEFDPQCEEIAANLHISNDWSHQEFASICKQLKNHQYVIESNKGTLSTLRDSLVAKRAFLINLLQNPNLLEHESFTELLWAVFHLAEELEKRSDVNQLSDKDREHLEGDIERAYGLLLHQWLDYMKHLKEDYPYLFSLAIRTNPFNPDAVPEIQ